MNILLICACGMSTSLLVNRMKEVGSSEDRIEALPVDKLEHNVKDYQVVLVGPQIRYKFNDIKKICDENQVACGLMDMASYGQMNGKVMYEQAKNLVVNK